MTSNSKQRQKTQNTDKENTSFVKEYLGNADLYTSLMNKIMITHE